MNGFFFKSLRIKFVADNTPFWGRDSNCSAFNYSTEHCKSKYEKHKVKRTVVRENTCTKYIFYTMYTPYNLYPQFRKNNFFSLDGHKKAS